MSHALWIASYPDGVYRRGHNDHRQRVCLHPFSHCQFTVECVSCWFEIKKTRHKQMPSSAAPRLPSVMAASSVPCGHACPVLFAVQGCGTRAARPPPPHRNQTARPAPPHRHQTNPHHPHSISGWLFVLLRCGGAGRAPRDPHNINNPNNTDNPNNNPNNIYIYNSKSPCPSCSSCSSWRSWLSWLSWLSSLVRGLPS